MQIVALSNDSLKQEFLATGVQEGIEVKWISSEADFLQFKNADAIFDLLFQPGIGRIKILNSFRHKPVFINDILKNKPVNAAFIRFNGWSSFLQRNILEASCNNESVKNNAATIMNALNRKIEWTADIPGFISARVVSMIINEAYFTLGEEVSSKADIDIAMKLGTNYPYGPFEWSEKIGLINIYSLLVELNKTSKRYEPAPLLIKEALP